MKYMLLIYGNDEIWNSFSQEDMGEVIRKTEALHEELFKSGELIGAYGVAGDRDTKVLSVRDGAPLITDGPYIEAKECLGSFEIIDVDSYERALEIAARNPASQFKEIEIRQLMHESPAPE